MDLCPPRVAVLMCHAPIVIPSIGGDRAVECAATTEAMEAAAGAVAGSGAETVLVISPHTPRHREAYGYVVGETLRGDFSIFGVRGLEASFRADAAATAAVARQAEKAGLSVASVKVPNLDHGALVPLWFLRQAGYKGRVAVFGFPWEAGPEASRRFGEAMAAAMGSMADSDGGQGRAWALIASGDMSHALQHGAPAGFHPGAHAFDESVVACVREDRIGEVARIDPSLRNLAAEDVVDSLLTAEGALGANHTGARFLSYEAPFGVGYMVAVLREVTLREVPLREVTS